MTNFQKKVICPDCGKDATLYTFGHRFEGIWECDNCGVSETCEHYEFHAEFDPEGGIVPVCDACEIVLDNDHSPVMVQVFPEGYRYDN